MHSEEQGSCISQFVKTRQTVGAYSRREMLALSSMAVLSACSPKAEHPTNVQASPNRRAEGDSRPNLMIFLVDSVRADFMGYAGGVYPISSRIDALAREGIVFDRCYSCSSWTKPSIATMFTGVLPRVHQTATMPWTIRTTGIVRSVALPHNLGTLAESLGKAGYDTGYFLGTPVVGRSLGFDRGFAEYQESFGDSPGQHVDKVIGWLSEKARPPFFAMIHLMAPHYPYLPPEELFAKLFGKTPRKCMEELPEFDRQFLTAYLNNEGRPFRGPDNSKPYLAGLNDQELEQVRQRHLHALSGLSPQGLELFRRLYAAEIAWVDEALGRLVDQMQSLRLLDETVTLFTSDHGEAFKDHEMFYHSNPLHEDQIRVPLIVRLPQGRHAGMHVRVPVSLIDIGPTLAAFAKTEFFPYAQGKRLFSEDGAPVQDAGRAVWANNDLESRKDTWDSAMILGSLKVLTHQGMELIQVFDVEKDPVEQENLAAQTPSADSQIQGLLTRFEEERKQHVALEGQLGAAKRDVETDEQTKKRLEALGYF